MNYKHLSIEERSCIRKYYVEGLSYRKIAKLIGRNVSTVSREIRRNCTHMYDIPTYYPHTAQKKYLLRRSYCHRGMFKSQEVIEYINEKLRATWSPEQISCTPCELPMSSWRTIYRWIYEKYLVDGNLKVLQRKGKTHGVKETRGKYSKGKSIRKRDKSVYSRTEAGHWELDTVVNGLLRELYPKGRNLSRVSPTTLKRNLALLNARPRKVLNFLSPQFLWDLELLYCCT